LWALSRISLRGGAAQGAATRARSIAHARGGAQGEDSASQDDPRGEGDDFGEPGQAGGRLHVVGTGGEGPPRRPLQQQPPASGLHTVGEGGGSRIPNAQPMDDGREVGSMRPVVKRGARKKKAKQQDPRAPRHPTAPEKLEYPPWVRTRQAYDDKIWLGRKANTPKYLEEKFESRKQITEQREKKGKPLDWDVWYSDKRRVVSVRSANYLMRLLLETGEQAGAGRVLDVFEKMPEAGLERDDWSYCSAMEACCSLGDSARALALLDEMKSVGLESPAAYTTAMHGLVKCGRPQRAMELFKEMEMSGLKPTTEAYTVMLTIAAERGDILAMNQVKLDMMVVGSFPDKHTYNQMLFGCARAGDGPKALDLMEEMKQYNIPRDIGAHNATLKALCDGGMEEEANKMFNDMLASASHGDAHSTPNLETYTVILGFYAKRGQVTEVVDMLTAVQNQAGMEVDAVAEGTLFEACYNALIPLDSLAQRREFGKLADELLSNSLLRFGKQPKEAGYLITKNIHVWAATMSPRVAEDRIGLFDEYGAKPGPMVFAALMNMYERMSAGDEARACLQRMQGSGLIPSASFRLKVALAYARAGNTEEALKVCRETAEVCGDLSELRERYSLDYALLKQWSPPNAYSYPADSPAPQPEDIRAWRAALIDACGDWKRRPGQKALENAQLLELTGRRYVERPDGGWGPMKEARVVMLREPVKDRPAKQRVGVGAPDPGSIQE
jgi:pentatricopeptide repeat protein